MTEEGKTRLRQVAQHILAVPKRLDMEVSITRRADYYHEPNRYPECGTVGCIAGWTCELFAAIPPHTVGRWSFIRDRAIRLIDPHISDYEWDKLFYVPGWPFTLREEYAAASVSQDYKRMAEVTVEAIEHFIATH